MFGKKKLVIVGALVLGLLTVGIGGTVVLAQGPTTTPTSPSAGATPSSGSSSSATSSSSSTSSSPSTSATPSTSSAQSLSDLFWQALAQRLGTTVDKLKQAVTGAVMDTLTQAVKQGLLTQNQANALQQRLQNGQVPGFFGFPGARGARGAQNNVRAAIQSAALDAAAKALGMSTADLQTALRNGQTLLALAQQKNVDVTQLRTAIANAEKAAIDQAVKNGQLTQAQGDSMKANITPDNINLNQRFFGFGNGFGRGGMRGGMGPGMGPGGMTPPGRMGPPGQGFFR